MTKPNSRRARKRALNIPPSQIRWADTPRPNTRWRTASTCGLATVGLLGLGAAASSAGGNTPRLAPNQACAIHVVVPGDTVFAIAGQANVTLDVIARLNPQVPVLSRIWPGDQIATSCPAANEVQRVELAPAVVLVNVDRYLGERDAPNVASKKAVLAALYKAGARGNQLVTLAAITEAESGRRLDAKGDVDIATGAWDYSAGVWQIRGVKAEKGKGTTRDVVRCHTLEGGAKSAVELWNQAQERGQDPGTPWSVYKSGLHVGMMQTYTDLATEMDVLR